VLQLSFADLLLLEDGLKSMDGTSRRLAFADFTIWPTGAGENGWAELDKVYKKTQEEQLKNKWNQPQ
jgi:hypothetical protein